MDRALFGPAGSSTEFSENHRSSLEAPGYLERMGLDCFEYQCGRGVNIGDDKAAALGRKAEEHNIKMSLHSPYFINLSSADPERMAKNLNYMLSSAHTCALMGGDRIVVHCGGLSKMTRRQALDNTIMNIAMALGQLEEAGLSHISLCLETMGKMNVLGDLEEVLEVCSLFGEIVPCIDFGHLNCRTQGGMSTEEHFSALLDRMTELLGPERAGSFHGHFSKIEYSKGGEVRHLTFEDEVYGPEFEPLGRLLARRGLTPRIICESAGTQDRDALFMKETYIKYIKDQEEE